MDTLNLPKLPITAIRYDGAVSTVPECCPQWSVIHRVTEEIVGEVVDIGSTFDPQYEAWIRGNNSGPYPTLLSAVAWIREQQGKKELFVWIGLELMYQRYCQICERYEVKPRERDQFAGAEVPMNEKNPYRGEGWQHTTMPALTEIRHMLLKHWEEA